MRQLEDSGKNGGDNDRFQSHVSSGRPRVTAHREDKLVVRSAVTVPISSLSTIRRVTLTGVSAMTIQRQLIEQNLRSYRPLRHLPLTPAQNATRLQWYLAR
ncbi:HTH_Tnp_Tc3_2 domain-containing protein [Trichonephila clavipes]|nr:HTH_Tnp_Tc3_2 domain-containing protein [Trichonephila clavipes]